MRIEPIPSVAFFLNYGEGGYKRCSDQMNTPLNGNVAWQKSVTKKCVTRFKIPTYRFDLRGGATLDPM